MLATATRPHVLEAFKLVVIVSECRRLVPVDDLDVVKVGRRSDRLRTAIHPDRGVCSSVLLSRRTSALARVCAEGTVRLSRNGAGIGGLVETRLGLSGAVEVVDLGRDAVELVRRVGVCREGAGAEAGGVGAKGGTGGTGGRLGAFRTGEKVVDGLPRERRVSESVEGREGRDAR